MTRTAEYLLLPLGQTGCRRRMSFIVRHSAGSHLSRPFAGGAGNRIRAFERVQVTACRPDSGVGAAVIHPFGLSEITDHTRWEWHGGSGPGGRYPALPWGMRGWCRNRTEEPTRGLRTTGLPCLCLSVGFSGPDLQRSPPPEDTGKSTVSIRASCSGLTEPFRLTLPVSLERPAAGAPSHSAARRL